MRSCNALTCAVISVCVSTHVTAGWTQETSPTTPLVDRVVRQRELRSQVVESMVAAALDRARRGMAHDPATAETDLKILWSSIKATTDLSPDVRTRLLERLKAAIAHAAAHRIRHAQRVQADREAQADRAARVRRLAAGARREATVAALMERFNALMDEGRFQEAGDELAAQAAAIVPQNPAVAAAADVAEAAGAYHDMVAIARQGDVASARSLLGADRAAISLAGDSPIRYPAAEVWHELSRRREKYAAVDMHVRSPREERILKALDEPSRLDFEDAPLIDVAAFLADFHGIEFVLDDRALAEYGIDGDTPVTIRVRGISLRSALRLMLRRIDPVLTFTARDEVLQITSREETENRLTTRSYPVGDLVLPVQNLDFAGTGGISAGGTAIGFGDRPAAAPGANNPPAFPQNDPFPIDF